MAPFAERRISILRKAVEGLVYRWIGKRKKGRDKEDKYDYDDTIDLI